MICCYGNIFCNSSRIKELRSCYYRQWQNSFVRKKKKKEKEKRVQIFSPDIRITFPCNIYPLIPHLYLLKFGYAEVNLFFLFLFQNIDCGYSLEPPQRGGSNVYPQSIWFEQKKKKKKKEKNIFSLFFTENSQFLQIKKICI